MVSPKSIGLINREQINQLLNKSKLMFKVSKFLTFCASFCCFCVSGIPLIINSTPDLYFLELLWILLFTVYGYHMFNINFSQMTYFYIICLYLKLKLRNNNNNIRKSFDGKYKMNNYKIKNIVKSLDSVIFEINIYNNDYW